MNNDRHRSFDVIIETVANGWVEEWDALTGQIREVKARQVNGTLRFDARFGPADSKLYVIDGQQAPSVAEPEKPPQLHTQRRYTAFGPVFRFTRTMPNVLTLDMCIYRIGDNDWSEEMQVWQAQQNIRDVLGMRQIYYNGITQRYKWIRDEHPRNGTPVCLKLMFHVKDVPANRMRLVIEGAQQFCIRLNGEAVDNVSDGWFVDRAFDQLPLPGVRAGTNELELICSYHNAMELEDVYLIGDFAVSANRAIVSEPQELRIGDWCLQGYFHYNGSIIYHADYTYCSEEGQRALLVLGAHSAVTVEIRINGQTAGHVPWAAADGLDVTAFLQEGNNALEIEVMSSPRNMFGPFHQAQGRTATTGWESFRKEGADFTPEYNVQPYGLFEQIRILHVPQGEERRVSLANHADSASR